MKQYVKTINGTSVIKNRWQIVINKDGYNIYNPSEEMLLEDGWTIYIPNNDNTSTQESNNKDAFSILQEIILEHYNARTDISDEEALDRAIVINNWENYIGKHLSKGQVVVYNETVYRVRQDIPEVLRIYPPSLDTAALYEVIVLTASGDIDNPIPYTPPMEIFEGKYYIQNDVKYLCIKDSEIPMNHNLNELITLYTQVVE